MAGLYSGFETNFGKKYYHLQGLDPVASALGNDCVDGLCDRRGRRRLITRGLTLVLMVLAVVLDWPIWQSVVSVMLVLLLYVAACLLFPGDI